MQPTTYHPHQIFWIPKGQHFYQAIPEEEDVKSIEIDAGGEKIKVTIIFREEKSIS